MVSWGPWNYRRNLNTVSCGEFTLVDVQKIWSTPHFHNRWIFGILCHQFDIFTIFCSILTIDFSGPLNNTTDPKTKKYTITQVDSKHKTFLTRDCMKGRFMTFYVTILKKKTIFCTFSVSCPAASIKSLVHRFPRGKREAQKESLITQLPRTKREAKRAKREAKKESPDPPISSSEARG